jgi:hypothetical protein
MKKIVVFLLLGFASFLSLAGGKANAADEIVDLYPYDQPGCLTTSDTCTATRVGTDNWTFTYGGYRYHSVRNSVRYVSDLSDDNSDGFISGLEVTMISYGSFGSTFINNTNETVVLKTDTGVTDRKAFTDATAARHDVYLHFDENGILQMFEAAVETFYITNISENETPEWRLATQAEIDAYDASSDPENDFPNMAVDNIRVVIDDTDDKGYKLERLQFTKYIADGVNPVDDPVSAWSELIDGNPVDLTIEPGWTIMSFAFLDRTRNEMNLDFIYALPSIMTDETTDPMVAEYTHQPPVFSGLTALDDDEASPGINVVVEYNGTFDLSNTVSVSWLDMLDDSGEIINSEENLDYTVDIMKDDVVLETISFVYNSENDTYTPSAAVTQIDSSEFGAGYKAIYNAVTPEGDETEISVDIVIGVMPPRFAGVEDRFINQSVAVDLLDGITADDGYGNDKTDSIIISYPEALNVYNPFPGEYQIDLEFTHHVHFDGVPTVVTLNAVDYELDRDLDVNVDQDVNVHTSTMVFTDQAIFREIGSGYGSQFAKIGVDGTVVETYDRYNWNYESTEIEGVFVGDAVHFAAWQAAVTLAEGEFIVTAHGSAGTHVRSLNIGDPATFEIGSEDFDYDIVTTDSYILTVDDMTAPILMVVNENYSIYAGEYDNKDDAILANVVAYDFTDVQADLVKYVSNNGGLDLTTPGTYTVEVTVEDAAGHTDVQSFDIVVKEAMLTEVDVEALIEDNTLSAADVQALIEAEVFTEADIVALIEANVLSEEDVQDLIDAGVITEAQIQELIDASLPEDTGCGSAITGTSAIFATFSILLGAAAIFFIRKRR